MATYPKNNHYNYIIIQNLSSCYNYLQLGLRLATLRFQCTLYYYDETMTVQVFSYGIILRLIVYDLLDLDLLTVHP